MHPPFASGDVLLRAHDPFAASVVVDAYDPVKRMLVWVCPQTDTSGIGPPELYMLAPKGWQDAPRSDHYFDENGEFSRSALVRFHLARIDWARRHLVRVEPNLALAEIRNAYEQLDSLRDAA